MLCAFPMLARGIGKTSSGALEEHGLSTAGKTPTRWGWTGPVTKTYRAPYTDSILTLWPQFSSSKSILLAHPRCCNKGAVAGQRSLLSEKAFGKAAIWWPYTSWSKHRCFHVNSKCSQAPCIPLVLFCLSLQREMPEHVWGTKTGQNKASQQQQVTLATPREFGSSISTSFLGDFLGSYCPDLPSLF